MDYLQAGDEIFAGLVSPGQCRRVVCNFTLGIITAQGKAAYQGVVNIMEKHPDNLEGILAVLLALESADTDKVTGVFGVVGDKRLLQGILGIPPALKAIDKHFQLGI